MRSAIRHLVETLQVARDDHRIGAEGHEDEERRIQGAENDQAPPRQEEAEQCHMPERQLASRMLDGAAVSANLDAHSCRFTTEIGEPGDLLDNQIHTDDVGAGGAKWVPCGAQGNRCARRHVVR